MTTINPPRTAPDTPVLAPRCRLHRPQQPKTCPRCRMRRRTIGATRRAAIAAGTWERLVDAGPIVEHIRRLSDSGAMTYPEQARRAGIDLGHLGAIARGRIARLLPQTARALLALSATPDPMTRPRGYIRSFVVARRIRGLAADGWSSRTVAARLGVTPGAVRHWTQGEWVRISTAEKVTALTEELWGMKGPNPGAARLAIRMGWFPLDAWGDRIDDPDAFPFHWSGDDQVDEVRVLRATQGQIAVADLTRDERVEAIRILARRGHNDREIAETMNWRDGRGKLASGSVGQVRRRAGIASPSTPST